MVAFFWSGVIRSQDETEKPNLRRKNAGKLRRMIISLATAYVLLCALLYLFQRSLLYHPTGIPAERIRFQEEFEVDGAVLKISTHSRKTDQALIYFGGNGEDVSGPLSRYAKAFPKCAIFMMHYRGYGGSTGSPTEANIHQDAQKLLDKVKANHGHIILVGRSLGTGVAVRLAAKNDIDRLVLITPYDSILRVAQSRFFFVPVGWMLKDKFESWRFAPDVKTPTTILAAEHDQVIKAPRTKALLDSFSPGIATMHVIKNVGHNSISADDDYMSLIQDQP